jgi:hypothetical protein
MPRMVQAPARISISLAERLFVSTTTSAGISRGHVTIWQSSRNTVGWRQAGVVVPAKNKRVLVGQRTSDLQYPKLIILFSNAIQKQAHVWCGSIASF